MKLIIKKGLVIPKLQKFISSNFQITKLQFKVSFKPTILFWNWCSQKSCGQHSASIPTDHSWLLLKFKNRKNRSSHYICTSHDRSVFLYSIYPCSLIYRVRKLNPSFWQISSKNEIKYLFLNIFQPNFQDMVIDECFSYLLK